MDLGQLDLGQFIVIGLSVILLVWYVVFGYLNRKRGIQIYRWLRTGLERIGQTSDVEWIGSSGSGGKIVLNSEVLPFERVEVIFLMEPREILPLWLFNILRNKRDELILKATLKSPPSQEVEVARERDREFSQLLVFDKEPTFFLEPAPEGFQIASRGKKKLTEMEQLVRFLQQEGAGTQNISLRRKTPHLIIRVFLSPSMHYPAEDFFSSIQSWLH